MANLKGGYSKEKGFAAQIKDIHHRLSAFGEKRFGKESHLTHSYALSKKRAEFSKSFAKFIKDKNLDGKLNHHMTDKNIKQFLEQRIANSNYSQKTAINYISSFGSMIQGLKEKNIDIDFNKKIISDLVKNIKETKSKSEIRTNRAIQNVDQVIKDIKDISFTASVIFEVQLLGYRLAEAFNICSDVTKYFNPVNSTLESVTGKGNHTYEPKPIKDSLVNRIKSIDKMISKKTYHNILSRFGIKSHDARYTFAKTEFNRKIANGENYQQILKDIAVGLNHTQNRSSMTRYYLSMA